MRATRADRREAALIADARGRRVSALDPVTLRILHEYDTVDRATLTAVVEDVGPGIERWPRRAFVFGVVGIGLVLLVLAWRLTLQALSTGAFPADEITRRLPIFIAITAGLWFQWYAAKRVRLGRVRDAMLARRRCPHCGYDMRELPADPEDGATVCPECGCAWTVSARDPDAT